MGLIDIPPYVLAGESPPHHAEDRRAFHLRSWEVPEPIAFPREVFAETLTVHARLLEENGSRGLKVEIHKWRPQEVSYVVQRCRGIVRKLMEESEIHRMYVVVVAAGAASLHVVRARPRSAWATARAWTSSIPRSSSSPGNNGTAAWATAATAATRSSPRG